MATFGTCRYQKKKLSYQLSDSEMMLIEECALNSNFLGSFKLNRARLKAKSFQYVANSLNSAVDRMSFRNPSNCATKFYFLQIPSFQ